MDILAEITAKTKERIQKEEREIPLAVLRRQAEELAKNEKNPFAFEKALQKNGTAFICEVKKASPSKGIIAEHFPYVQIAEEYEEAGASAISCLTEPFYFKGKDEYLREIVQNVNIPVLRKDFTVSAYMIYQAKVLGASAVLLICSILDKGQLAEYLALCDELQLSALTETHTEDEIDTALAVNARIFGVNNRNLKTFQTDVRHSIALRSRIPADKIFVSESGIHSPEDIALLQEHKVNAVLIGESMMKAADKKAFLAALQGKSHDKN